MKALRPPTALAAHLTRLFALDDEAVAALERTLSSARARDAGGVAQGLVGFSTLSERTHVLADAIGIDCTPR